MIKPKSHKDSYTLPIGGVPFKVSFQDKVFDEGDECDGLTSGSEEKIEICSTLPGHKQARVTFHEIIHSCLHVGGVTQILKGDQEEAVVQCLEYMLWPLVDLRPEIKDKLDW